MFKINDAFCFKLNIQTALIRLATIVNSEIRVTDGANLSQQANCESRSEVDQ